MPMNGVRVRAECDVDEGVEEEGRRSTTPGEVPCLYRR